jgi:hypothetical protein
VNVCVDKLIIKVKINEKYKIFFLKKIISETLAIQLKPFDSICFLKHTKLFK